MGRAPPIKQTVPPIPVPQASQKSALDHEGDFSTRRQSVKFGYLTLCKWQRFLLRKCFRLGSHTYLIQNLKKKNMDWHQNNVIFNLQSGSYLGPICRCVSIPARSDLLQPLPEAGGKQNTFTSQNHNRKKNCYHKRRGCIPQELVHIDPLIPCKHQCMNGAQQQS